jgi:hypothetical protein
VTTWSEASIARAIQRTVFQRKCLLLVPNVAWMVAEADVLGVTPDGRLIDIEIKISRADLKADAAKDKWWRRPPSEWIDGRIVRPPATHRDWPPRVWRHYYVVPAEIWRPDLAPALGSPKSGVLTIADHRGSPILTSVRRAHSNPDARKLTAVEMLDVARLANLRMWDALVARDDAAARALREEAA